MSARIRSLVKPRNAALTVAAVATMVTLSGFGYLIADSTSKERAHAENRFQSRSQLSAAMTESLFATAGTAQREATAKAFGGRKVNPKALAALARKSRLHYAAILDAKGRLLAATPRTPLRVLRRIAGLPPEVRAALGGRPYLSDLRPSPGGGAGVIDWAAPFETRFGRRVQITGTDASQLKLFLGAYLSRVVNEKMQGYLLDGEGHLLADATPGQTKGKLSPKQLLGLVSRTDHGTIEEAGTELYFTASPVGGSAWRVALAEPKSELYPPIASSRSWLLWIVLAGFGVCACVSLLLLRRTIRGTERLTAANEELSYSREELASVNASLEQQTRVSDRATRAKSEFLANMSHELRTPLNAIIGFSQLMLDGKAGQTETERREFMTDILQGARHLQQLINDILDLSKVEAGKIEFHPEPVDLQTLVDELINTVRVLAHEKEIELVRDISPEIGEVVLDRAKLKQVLYNYLSNAIKFTPERGRVTVRFLPEGDNGLLLEVEDTGIGIRAADQDKLFTEFQQLDQSHAKEHQGTGLGLALVKRLVEAQGGSVGVRSVPGEGSRFYALLPRVAAVGEQVSAMAPSFAPPGAPSVLVVEDDRGDQVEIERSLSRAGYDVEVATTGAEAIARARERHFDAVTLDFILPDMGGLEVLRGLRREGRNPEVPVLAVTVVSESEIGKAFTITDWLVKPVDESKLLIALRRAGVEPDETRTVLVVDDDAASARLAEATIRQLGCRIISAPDGEQGLELADREPIAAVVLDLLMPGIGGFEFLDRLRATEAGKSVPVVIWTHKDLTAEDYSRLQLSAQAVVMKGDDGPMSLVDGIEQCLAGIGNGANGVHDGR